MKLQQMNNNPSYQQSMCASCTTFLESNTATTRKRHVNETITTANDTVRLVPELRFPEFQNAAEWRLEKLGNCLLQVPDYGVNAPAVPYSDKLPVYLRITDISEDGQFISDGKVSVDVIATVHNSLQVGDIVFARTGATVGKVYKYKKEDGPLVFAGFLIRVKPNASILNPDFLFQYLQTSEYKKWVEMTSTRSGQPGINSTEIESLVIPIPPTSAEQQKIAFFLQSIDNEIVTTKLKLDQLKTHKKALLQQLFPQRGKTVPEFRFPEFQDAGEWEEVKLGDIIIVHSGRDYKHLNHGNVPVYGTGGYMLSVDDYLSEIDAVGIGRKGTIDKPQYLKAPFWTVDTLFYMTANVGYDVKFIYYLSQTIAWKKYGEQTGVPSLSKVSIENMEIYVSTNIAEQRKIADAFSSLDDSIDSCSKKISELLQHKKGLMQKLFPLNI